MAKKIFINNENNDYQHIDVIKRNRYKRHKYKKFFVEGVKAINLVLQEKWSIDSFVIEEGKTLSRWASEIIENSIAKTHYYVKPSLFEKISDKEKPSELIGIIDIPDDSISRIKLSNNPLVVVLDRPANPGNIGSIIRSCDAMKVDGLIITGHSADLYDPQTVRASIGSIFTLPIVRLESYSDVYDWVMTLQKKVHDISIVGSSAHSETTLSKYDFTKPIVLLIGNETSGLSKNFLSICNDVVKIPIFGSVSSLNVSNAASIMIYEISKQRGHFDI